MHCLFSVVSQSYTVNLWEENVLRGNAAILKCHIPSFVTEYVTVTSWIISEGEQDEMEINLNSEFKLGNMFRQFHPIEAPSILSKFPVTLFIGFFLGSERITCTSYFL